jgi:hypothetical protein
MGDIHMGRIVVPASPCRQAIIWFSKDRITFTKDRSHYEHTRQRR